MKESMHNEVVEKQERGGREESVNENKKKKERLNVIYIGPRAPN